MVISNLSNELVLYQNHYNCVVIVFRNTQLFVSWDNVFRKPMTIVARSLKCQNELQLKQKKNKEFCKVEIDECVLVLLSVTINVSPNATINVTVAIIVVVTVTVTINVTDSEVSLHHCCRCKCYYSDNINMVFA